VPLARRIRDGVGFHSTAEARVGCAACHQEHQGEDFRLVRFDTLAFDHASVGYELEGGHAEASCRSCHTPALVADLAVRDFKGRNDALDRTFLGLPTQCVSCHRADDPHGVQFADRACTACHTTETWSEAPGFDHAAARYPLTGLHASVDCASCHVAEPSPGGAASRVRYTPLSFGTCTSCHADPHAGAMTGTCATCHSTEGWSRVTPGAVEGRFQHGTTGFPLEGSHARADCASCHSPGVARPASLRLAFVPSTLGRAFPAPVAIECLSCHVDAHDGALADAPGGPGCTSCHGQEEWVPASYGIARHNLEARFPLEGAHLTVACESCHRADSGRLVLEPLFDSCTSCHAAEEPHGTQFAARTCDSCHDVSSFAVPSFDHSRTRFALDGGHEDVACAGCHATEEPPGGSPFVRYTPIETACVACHSEDVR
jgi:hypothetical protein